MFLDTLEAAENSTFCTLEIPGESNKEAGLKLRGIFNKVESGFGIGGDDMFSYWVVFSCGTDPPVLAHKLSTKNASEATICHSDWFKLRDVSRRVTAFNQTACETTICHTYWFKRDVSSITAFNQTAS